MTDKLQVEHQLELAANLPKDFIQKKIHEASTKCLANPGPWNDFDLSYWCNLYQIRSIIDKVGKDYIMNKFDEHLKAGMFYSLLKQ